MIIISNIMVKTLFLNLAMTPAEIFKVDIMRVERRKNEPSRKQWTISNVTTPLFKYDFFTKKIILFCLLFEVMFWSMYPNKKKM